MPYESPSIEDKLADFGKLLKAESSTLNVLSLDSTSA
jgi:hypothetical protein